MTDRYEQTSAMIDYEGRVDLNLAAIAQPLADRLKGKGFEFNAIGLVDGEDLQFIGSGLVVTVNRDPARPNRVRILAETPVAMARGRTLSRTRFAACAAAVRHFIFNLPAERVVWQHKGRSYVTAAGKDISVEPRRVRRALPGSAASRRPAARAGRGRIDMTVPSHDHVTERLNELRAEFRRLDAEAGNAERLRTVPEKLTLYSLNTTLMVVSLPVGAGMMTYNLLSGGSVSGTARAMGVTGAAIGLGSLPATQSLAGIADSAAPGLSDRISAVALPVAETLNAATLPLVEKITAAALPLAQYLAALV